MDYPFRCVDCKKETIISIFTYKNEKNFICPYCGASIQLANETNKIIIKGEKGNIYEIRDEIE